MTFLILWGAIWAALFALAVLAVALTPTTAVTPPNAGRRTALWCGGISFVLALTLHGAVNLISGIFT